MIFRSCMTGDLLDFEPVVIVSCMTFVTFSDQVSALRSSADCSQGEMYSLRKLSCSMAHFHREKNDSLPVCPATAGH